MGGLTGDSVFFVFGFSGFRVVGALFQARGITMIGDVIPAETIS